MTTRAAATMRAAAAGTLLSATPLGCDRLAPPDNAIDCTPGPGDPVRVAGTTQAWRDFVDGHAVVHVSGTAAHADGLAILRIEVARAAALPVEGAFNFSEWAVDLDLDTVAALPSDAGTGMTALSVRAFDACDRSYELDPVRILLRDPPVADAVEVDIAYPGGEDHLPGGLSVPAAVTVRATGDAAGLAATLVTERGAFLGAPGDGSTVTVTLAPDEDAGAASAIAYLTASGAEPGQALVSAAVQGLTATARLRVAGPPTFFPPGPVELLFDADHPVSVLSEGRIVTCEALPPPGVTVEYLGLSETGVFRIDEADSRHATVDVRVDRERLVDRAQFSIACVDAFGQAASARFVTPAPGEEAPE